MFRILALGLSSIYYRSFLWLLERSCLTRTQLLGFARVGHGSGLVLGKEEETIAVRVQRTQ